MTATVAMKEFQALTGPGETVDQALLRKVKMHEFLMTGGVKTGINEYGMVVYSDPITVMTSPICPWHDKDCPAWDEIVDGRGHWTRIERELGEALADLADAAVDSDEQVALSLYAEKLLEQLELRPRDALALRERTTEQVEAEKAEYQRKRAKGRSDLDRVAAIAQEKAQRMSGVMVPAGPKTGGNPWDRKTTLVNERTGEIREPRLVDSRDEAIEAFGAVPDTIEIDGEEGDE